MIKLILLSATLACVGGCPFTCCGPQTSGPTVGDRSKTSALKAVLFFGEDAKATRGLAEDLYLRIENVSNAEVSFYDISRDRSGGSSGSPFRDEWAPNPKWDLPIQFLVGGIPAFFGTEDDFLDARIIRPGESLTVPLYDSMNALPLHSIQEFNDYPIQLQISFESDGHPGWNGTLLSNKVEIIRR